MKVGKLPPGQERIEVIVKNLSFAENFGGFEATLDIDASEEVSIRNLLNGATPSRFVILDAKRRSAGTVIITRGDVQWTSSNLTLQNDGTADATITVAFLP